MNYAMLHSVHMVCIQFLGPLLHTQPIFDEFYLQLSSES